VVVTELLKEPGLMLKKTLFLPQVGKCLSGETNFDGGLDYHGDQVFGYWRWFPEIKSCLVTKMNRAEALAPIAQAAVILMGVVILIGVSVGVFGYMMGKLMMRPLAKLREEAQKIREGNFEVSTITETKDEIGEVALAFNEMGRELKEIYADLENKVKEKTIELSKKLEEMNTLNITLSENKSAMVNLLEDAKSLEEQLKTEKAGVEKKVEERTRQLSEERAELLAVINAIARGLMVVDKNWKVILENETLGKIMGKNGACGQLTDLAEYLSSAFDLNKVVAETFAKQSDVMAGPGLIGNRYLNLHVVPVMHESQVGAAAIFVKDVTETTNIQRSRDEFFSIASHELRTPLTAIRGNAEMILDNYKDKITDKDVTEMLGDIHEGSVRLIEIVNDFLNVSRLEMGKLEFKLEEVDLVELIGGVIKEFSVTGSRQKLKLELAQTETKKYLVMADRDRLKQVLINLIGNGFKFTTEGGVNITLTPKNETVEVWVSDTGAGIAPEQQGLLFHKFQQAGSSLYTRDTSKGTGLGLYISKLMMEGMGGKVWLEKSEPGKGSTFAFSLPIFDAQQVSIDKKV
jgi:signal transduction histidine kinase/HAMP domain-containing protein